MLKHEKEMEKQKFKEMTTKEKINHIVEYYKWHIIGVLGVIFFIYSLLNIYIFNPPMKPSVQVALVGSVVDNDTLDSLRDLLNNEFPELVTDREEVILLPITMSDAKTDPNMYMAATQKLFAMTASKEIDIMIGNKDIMMAYGEQGYFVNLEDVLTDEQLSKLEGELIDINVIIEQDDTSSAVKTEVHRSLIDISHKEYISDIFYGDEIYIGLVVNSQRMENAKKIFNYITEKLPE